MSTHIPSLSQSAPDLDTDSDYLGTPVDPPSHCQPYVAGYEPLEYYYSAGGYDSAVYPGGPQYADSAIAGASPQHGLLLQSNYPINTSRDCNQSSDSAAIAAYHIVSPNHHTPLVSSAASPTTTNTPSNAHESSFDAINHTLQYPEYEGEDADCSQKISYPTVYPKIVLRPSELALSTSSYPSVYPSSLAGNAAYGHRGYYEEAYADSPIEDPAYGDHYPDSSSSTSMSSAANGHRGYYEEAYADSPIEDPAYGDHYPDSSSSTSMSSAANGHRGYYEEAYADSPIEDPAYGDHYPDSNCPYEQHAVYEQYQQHPEPRADTHFHAPRPQPVHDLYTLHSNTVPRGDSYRFILPSHRVVSIPPIPWPTPLIEDSPKKDSPKKPLTLACYFCRKRKIACSSPPENAQDRTCDQCAKRKLKCVYPATSRRGMRSRSTKALVGKIVNPSPPSPSELVVCPASLPPYLGLSPRHHR